MIDVRPHWSVLAGPVSVLAVVIAGALTAVVDGVPTWVDWPILAVLVAAAGWMLVRYLGWATTRLVLTTGRIIERRGVLARVSREIPLAAVTEIGVRRTLAERMLRTGDVIIESPARDGAEVFTHLPRPALIRDEIYAQMNAGRFGVPGPSFGGPGPTGGGASIPEQIRALDQLRREGALSDVEFERKKAELLDRL